MFTLAIDERVSEHSTLRDARRALLCFKDRRGLWLTVSRWTEVDGVAVQRGQLMQGADAVADWEISYPVGIETYPVSA